MRNHKGGTTEEARGEEAPQRHGGTEKAEASGALFLIFNNSFSQFLFPLGLWVSVVGLLLSGCATAPALPPVDLSQPGWDVRESPALWRPRRDAPELAGELLVAVQGKDRLVQFSKQGLPVVTAVVTSNRWQVTSALRAGIHGGRLPAPAGVLWFAVDASPPKIRPERPWSLDQDGPEDRWRLTNTRTGEFLEVVPTPP